MPTLAVYRGDSLIELIPIRTDVLRIGRLAENDVVLADDGKAVSRFHAELRWEGGTYVIHDLKSQNGTWVEAKRVSRAVLVPGKDVVIGPYRLTLRDEERQEPEAPLTETVYQPIASHERSAAAVAPAVAAAGSPGPAPAVPQVAARTFDWKHWIATQPHARWYGIAAVSAAAVVLLAVLAGRGGAVEPEPESPPPVRREDGPVDIEAEQVKAAVDLLGRGQYEEALAQHLEPLLATNPSHREAGLLWTQANIALAPVPVAEDLPRPVKTPPSPEVIEEPGIPRLTAEAPADYFNRVGQARAQYDYGESLLAQQDWLGARRVFEGLEVSHPGYRDVSVKVQTARERIAEIARTAVAAGRKLEESEDFKGAVRQYEQAREYGANVDADVARAYDTARTIAKELMGRAKLSDNYSATIPARRAEAIRMYSRIVDLLLPGEPDYDYAVERLRRLEP